MGCGESKPAGKSTSKSSAPSSRPKPGTDRFGRDPNLKPEDFMVDTVTGETIVRTPGKVGGQVFTIRKCTDCTIILLDHTDQVTVDHCTNTRIFIAACSSSLFIRNCTECDLVVGTQQFRMRDCDKVRTLLYSQTRPVIEASKRLSFGCFRFGYFTLAAHMEAAGLNPWNNKWSEVYDFSSRGGESPNWSPLSLDDELNAMAPPIGEELAAEVSFFDPIGSDDAIIPFTYGINKRSRPVGDELVFVCVLPGCFDAAHKVVSKLTRAAISSTGGGGGGDETGAGAGAGAGASAGDGGRRTLNESAPLLLRSRVYDLPKPQAKELLPKDHQSTLNRASSRVCLGLQFAGVGAVDAIQAAFADVSDIAANQFWLPATGVEARKASHNWFEAWEEENKH